MLRSPFQETRGEEGVNNRHGIFQQIRKVYENVAESKKSCIFAFWKTVGREAPVREAPSNSNGFFYCCSSTVMQYWTISPVFFLIPSNSLTLPTPSSWHSILIIFEKFFWFLERGFMGSGLVGGIPRCHWWTSPRSGWQGVLGSPVTWGEEGISNRHGLSRQIRKVYEIVADLEICCIFASVGRGHGVKNQWTIKT